MAPYETLQLETDVYTTTLTLNRPDKRNAISAQMIAELLAALAEIEAGPARALVLTGAGKAFCSGMDLEYLKAFSGQSPQQVHEDARRIASLYQRVYTFSKPLIAAVNGPAIAGGSGLAMLADLTLAVPEAKFGYTEVRVGFMPAIVATFVVRQLGEKRARDLLLTGRIFDAQEAHRLGLVNEVVPAAKLLERARELAASLGELSPLSLSYTKRLLCKFAQAEIDRDLGIAIEESTRIRSTSDFREGIAAFLEKRRAVWSGE